ncbi:hypothetical protein EUGRSUZ_J01323, partial [Eucalyptus grandis]
DDEELCIGEEIGLELLQAIKQSKISIPIFSEGYAASKWCLMKLVQMVECKEKWGQKIIPIFYGIEPWVVRKQTATYAQGTGNGPLQEAAMPTWPSPKFAVLRYRIMQGNKNINRPFKFEGTVRFGSCSLL